jgi:5'-nucleotidase
MRRLSFLVMTLVLPVALLAGCSSSDDTATEFTTDVPTTPGDSTSTTSTTSTTPTTSTTEPTPALTILVTNDDGIGAPGIDALVMALSALPDVEIVVVAPAENQSGSSDKTTDGEVTATAGATTSGVAGTAVAGFPADSVIYALDVLGVQPDVVVSGANTGQNIGTFVPLSGTVGAARTAARRGIPAIAVSAGGLEGSDYAAAAQAAADEVAAHRAEFGPNANAAQTVVNLNTPTCAPGTSVRGVVDVPVATVFPEGTNGLDLVFDCASTATDPADDATALQIGFAARSIVPADL